MYIFVLWSRKSIAVYFLYSHSFFRSRTTTANTTEFSEGKALTERRSGSDAIEKPLPAGQPIALPASALASASIWVLPGTDTLLSAACDRRACSLSSTLSSVNRTAHLFLSNGQLKLISGAWWESCNGCVITPIS